MASSDEKLSYYTKLYDDLKLFENGMNEQKFHKKKTQFQNRVYLCLILFKENPEGDLDGKRQKICGLDLNDSSDTLDSILNDLENSSVELAETICKLIADLAKDEKCRDRFIEKAFLPLINKYLEESLKTTSQRLKIQICRAIGNLCYYNGILSRFFFEVFKR